MNGGTEMDAREKLIDLIIDAKRTDPEAGSFTEYLADCLINNGVTVREWIPVEDKRKPKEGEDVLVAVFDGYDTYTDMDCLMRDGKWCFETENYKVTHWMEKPEPPKGE